MNGFIKFMLILVILSTLCNLIGQVVLWAPPVVDSDIAQGGGSGSNDTPGNNGNENKPDEEEVQKPVANVQISASVTPDENGQVPAGGVSINGVTASANVPEGVQMADGATELTLTIDGVEDSAADLNLNENEVATSLDVHMAGVSADNTIPMEVKVLAAMIKGLNSNNIKLYHVENGETVEMTYVPTNEDFSAHNQFKYNPATGDVTLYIAGFSEIAMIADTEKAWDGTIAADFNGGSGTEDDPYIIANAEQLAYFSAAVGGMTSKEAEKNSFDDKHIKLIADINLGDKDDASSNLFYPIGYYNDAKSYTKPTDGTATDANVTSFCGTFDGNGHTIANFYQNTWQMWGNYDGNYYKAAMGLFGYVVNGTIKNLTVDSFSSDGEYTPTGVIAAYAVNSTFENISITNCNPRVYNTGNGGIIGIAGREKADIKERIVLKNITVDYSNKISALWGSYDVACGGLVGMYRGNADNSGDTIHFEDCHVSAIMDVYNDVCANYQYYAYRYTGMIIGSVRHNTTNANGNTVPVMTGITANNCTVNFGTWNDYYYCELVANTTASYTHDHQMSRLTQVAKVDVENKKYLPLGVEDKNENYIDIPGGRVNYVVVNVKNENDQWDHASSNATCYHFVDGEVWNHEDAGYHNGENGEKFIDENGDGVGDLKEDKHHLYLEFNNLITGYGWGVSTIAIEHLDGITTLGISTSTIDESVKKFESVIGEPATLVNNKTYNLGEIFKFVNKGIALNSDALTVSITNLVEGNPVSATIVYDAKNWENGTIIFTGAGSIQITIQDYYFCTPTTITVNITERTNEKKFDVVMNNGDFLHRVGNSGTDVQLGKLFKAKDDVVGAISVTIETINGTGASGTYTPNSSDWRNGTIDFDGTGVVKVTIKDDDIYCIPTVLYLEVVNATNATGATNATSNNVVLLNDAEFGSLEVSGGYTFYGNGFTLTCGSDSPVLDFGYSFVKLDSGILDNVQIVCPNFDFAALYKSQLTSSDNRSQTTDRIRYYNAKSAINVSGNSQILNSRISGGRAAVNVTGGNCLIDNSRIELGAVASLLIGSANSVTLRDVTLIQKPTASTYDSSKYLMGLSVLYICDDDGFATETTLEGTLIQYAWADESCSSYAPEGTESIITAALSKDNCKHNINGSECINLGFAYMPADGKLTLNKPNNITDNRTNSNIVTYSMEQVKAKVNITIGYTDATTYVYTYTNTNGTANEFKSISEYIPNKYGDIITVNYSDSKDGLEMGKSFGTNGWVYELNVDLDKASGYKIDFSKLAMTVNGVSVTDYKVNGNAKPTSPVAVTAGGVTYTLTATVNGKECTIDFKVTGTETSKESPSKISGPTTAGFGVAKSYGGDWSGAADVLTGVKIKYWSVAENKYVEFDFSNFTVPGNAGKLNGTNSYWEYTHSNSDFTLKVTNTVAIHSGKSVYGMPIRGTDGKLYFTISSTNGYVGSGTTSRSVTMQYEFTDNNGGEKLTFTHTFNINYDKDNQYSYSDLSGSGKLTKLESSSGGGSCLAAGTLITLANGTKKPVEDLRKGDIVMSFDHLTGEIVYKDVIIVVRTSSDLYYKNTFVFDDGTELATINEHGIYDLDLNKYVNIDHINYADYIGHRFVSVDTNGNIGVKTLVNVTTVCESGYKYDIVTNGTLNYVAEDTLSVTHVLVDVINSFEFDEKMMYDQAKMLADIEKYGLYDFDEWDEYCDYSVFEQYNIPVMKVGISKGLYTKEYIISLINTYVLDDSVQIID